MPTFPTAVSVNVTEDALVVDLSDGRTIAVALAWFPRLLHGNDKERENFRKIGGGTGIHWDTLTTAGTMFGCPAGVYQ